MEYGFVGPGRDAPYSEVFSLISSRLSGHFGDIVNATISSYKEQVEVIRAVIGDNENTEFNACVTGRSKMLPSVVMELSGSFGNIAYCGQPSEYSPFLKIKFWDDNIHPDLYEVLTHGDVILFVPRDLAGIDFIALAEPHGNMEITPDAIRCSGDKQILGYIEDAARKIQSIVERKDCILLTGV